MTYEFTVTGNQENPSGNPIPYLRMTRNTKWTKEAKRYASWKEYVAREFRKETGIGARSLGKPIVLGKSEASVDIGIEWANGTHADCDNILKGILDSLFENDKNVTEGSFKSRMSSDRKGKVIIRINISEDEKD